MEIDHVGYAVKRLEKSRGMFENLGFCFEEIVDDHDRNIRICFGEKDGYRIELVQPLSRQAPSPVDTYLTRIGPVPYHFCYRTETFQQDMDALCENGFQILEEPKPAVAFGGRRAAFLIHSTTGMLEIVEKG